MLYLRTFGGCSLHPHDPAQPALHIQRRALALLTMLAAAGASGLSRDVVMARLWPERDEARARLSLRQLLHTLRTQLRVPDLVGAEPDLRLREGVVHSDVRAFHEALAAGDDAAAVSVYAGPFLDGFLLSGTNAFEDWVAQERAALAALVVQRLERLAAAASTAGELAASVECWRRLVTLEPLSTRHAIAYVRALTAAGNRAAAVQHARIHEALLGDEFGTPPTPELMALRLALRDAQPLAESARAAAPQTGATREAPLPAAAASPGASAAYDAGRRRRRMAASLTVLAVLVAIGVRQRLPTVPLRDGAHDDLATRVMPLADAWTDDPIALDRFRRGRRVFLSRSSPDGIREAIAFFEEAIARDSTFARAHAGLADAWTRLAIFGHAHPQQAFAAARLAAERAVTHDPMLAEAHAARAHVLLVADFAWAASEEAFRRAIALDSTYRFARAPFAIGLASQRRFDEALAQLTIALAEEPFSPALNNVRGRVLLSAGRPGAAESVLREILRLDPRQDLAWQQLGHALLALGRPEEALEAFRRAAAISGPRDSAHLAYAHGVIGERAQALAIIRTLMPPERDAAPIALHLGIAYAGLGEADSAFAWLDRAYAERASFVVGVAAEPALVRLHDDPRWTRLLGRMGLDTLP